ncbi:hypothetical protein AcV5_007860 [Taiwanofungus camphoratus]|nr:hypothetical protein AcV5_007860 [Antrodia cinnamomea]
MGNTTSNPASPNSHLRSPVRHASPASASSSIPSHRVHPSLRHKKKSLELPDLSPLTLTPASSSPSAVSPHPAYHRPRASSPIPIPAAPNPPQPTFRPQNNLPSAAHISIDHNEIQSNPQHSRYKSYLSSAYPSFLSRGQGSPPNVEEPYKPEFVPEVVHSTLPLALIKAEEDVGKLEPVSVKIAWRGGGKSVILARAGDNNWQGRQPMEFDPNTNEWSTYVSLLPGTHHLKFIVDDQWLTADDYPTAADDRDGTLANYVAVPFLSSSASHTPHGSGSGPTSPLGSPHHQHPHQFNSFWSEASSSTGGANGAAAGAEPGRGNAEPVWTTEIPLELIAAAAEEETYLAIADSPAPSSSSSASAFMGVPAPNVPPAPILPRHLDKLILNVRPATVTGSPGAVGADRDRTRRSGRERERSRRDRDSRARPSALGMTSTAQDGTGEGEHMGPPSLGLPVVNASGTDVTAAAPIPSPALEGAAKIAGAKLDFAGLADDASVLPVPSHVVLHHLSTSAIRNGVLAVANTTRYRKKYITTIYYKPT